jgi:hypothetical protein
MRCVKNWQDVFFVTRGIKKYAYIRFIDGTGMKFRKEDHMQLSAYCEYLDMPRKLRESLKITGKGDRFYLRIKGRTIRARFHTIAPLATEFYYNPHSRLSVKDRVVVDIGTYVGDTPLYYLVAGGARKVYGYALDKKYYDESQRLVKENGLAKRIKIFNQAITPQNINRLPFIRKLKDASLKCDIEGAEYKVFEAITDETLSHFKSIHIEYHYGYKPLVARLEEAGFSVEHTEPYYQINLLSGYGTTVQGDIYATRKSSNTFKAISH